MSVFKKLKGTFQNVQQDIVDGLRALTTLDSQPLSDQLKGVQTRDVNLNVGGDLLYNYQRLWNLIQTDTKESAAKASEASKLLAPMFKTWTKQAEGVQQLEEEVKHIPTLLSTLGQLQELIDGLRKDFMAAEKGLDMLENLCEEQEHKKLILEEENKLARYTLQREKEFERLKVDLAQRHARKMVQVESTKRAQLQERAEAFTSAFKEDLEFYRTHGRPDRLQTDFPKVSSLSEIDIDQDKQALDSFLGPATEAVQTQAAPTVEDTYFEDDYITGFAVKEDTDFVSEVEHLTTPAKIDSLSVEHLDESDEEQSASKTTESKVEANQKSSSAQAADDAGNAANKSEAATEVMEEDKDVKQMDGTEDREETDADGQSLATQVLTMENSTVT
ncbi:hypothetical protein PoB_003352200 [Plakobranchus ocellatus]|uniref:Dysbindin n=1 Tax=Plakobranchus ocellatus TaxID=259542 RepID=A0AAV4AJE3_9GAST|nr:hypothetical protein PoB_003352200 [Plakobranchus ocellatus]